jgi:hypothetical protein
MDWIPYPWSKIEVGQRVFIPHLDTDKLIAHGIRTARQHGITVEAVPGIRDGKLGVLFTRTS